MQPDACQSLLWEGRAGDCPALPSPAQLSPLVPPQTPTPGPVGLSPRLLPHSVICTCFCSLSHWHRASVEQIHCAVQCPQLQWGRGAPSACYLSEPGVEKGLGRRSFKLQEPYGLCHNYSILLFYHANCRRGLIKEWLWLPPNKTSQRKQPVD